MFTFLLSSRLFLPPYELMTRVCHLCVEQQRSGDALLDKVGWQHTHTHRAIICFSSRHTHSLLPHNLPPTIKSTSSLTHMLLSERKYLSVFFFFAQANKIQAREHSETETAKIK